MKVIRDSFWLAELSQNLNSPMLGILIDIICSIIFKIYILKIRSQNLNFTMLGILIGIICLIIFKIIPKFHQKFKLADAKNVGCLHLADKFYQNQM